MLKMMKNMSANFKEDKFKRIRLGNANFNSKVGGIDGGLEVSFGCQLSFSLGSLVLRGCSFTYLRVCHEEFSCLLFCLELIIVTPSALPSSVLPARGEHVTTAKEKKGCCYTSSRCDRTSCRLSLSDRGADESFRLFQRAVIKSGSGVSEASRVLLCS